MARLKTQHLAEPGVPGDLALFGNGVLNAVKAVGVPGLALAVLPELALVANPPIRAFLHDVENAPLIDLVADVPDH